MSCCLDLSVPSISFRINGQPVQGMFENFNSVGLFFPVASFSAGVKSVRMLLLLLLLSCQRKLKRINTRIIQKEMKKTSKGLLSTFVHLN